MNVWVHFFRDVSIRRRSRHLTFLLVNTVQTFSRSLNKTGASGCGERTVLAPLGRAAGTGLKH